MKARIEQVDISAGNTDDSSAADTADPKMQITSNVKEPIVVLGVNLSSYSLSQQFLVSCLLSHTSKTGNTSVVLRVLTILHVCWGLRN